LKLAALYGLSQVASKHPATAFHHPEHLTLTQGEVLAHAAGIVNINGTAAPL
jgi:hypothetical protein